MRAEVLARTSIKERHMPTLAEIKQKQQMIWSSGDYSKVAWLTQPLGDILCEAVDLRPGRTVLDVATGTGHVALAAARRFGEATGIDYVPQLLEHARRRAAVEDLVVTFVEGDAEEIPFPDDSFDYVLSTIGAMFAPDQEKVASELLRVCHSGGTIGMINWKPEGYLGELFRLIASYAPPPANMRPAALWGSEERVKELFGDGLSSLSFKSGALTHRFLSADKYANFFLTHYGPTLKLFETLDDERRTAFRNDIATLVERFNRADDGTAIFDADYLIVIAKKN